MIKCRGCKKDYEFGYSISEPDERGMINSGVFCFDCLPEPVKERVKQKENEK